MTRALALAKVNLYLEIVGRRPDGYHELRTLFQTVAWGDDVVVERTPGPGVVCTTGGADLPDDERNLAVRAATAWLAASGSAGGVRLDLTKRIPVGGGLGGGSSDAAAVLQALQGGTDALPRSRLFEVARGLGADVPFLLGGGTATATGRGDVVVRRIAAPRVALVLLLAPFGTDTGAVFSRAGRRLRRPPPGGLEAAFEALDSGIPSRIREAHFNDLAVAAMRTYPEMLRFTSLAERLLGRPPCMTGSGSTLFDVPDPGGIEAVLERLAPLPGRREVVWTAA